MPSLQSITMKVSERYPLVFSKLLQHRYVMHKILFHAQYNGTVLICRKHVEDAPVREKIGSDTFTKITGL